jgi:hypothetical protein
MSYPYLCSDRVSRAIVVLLAGAALASCNMRDPVTGPERDTSMSQTDQGNAGQDVAVDDAGSTGDDTGGEVDLGPTEDTGTGTDAAADAGTDIGETDGGGDTDLGMETDVGMEPDGGGGPTHLLTVRSFGDDSNDVSVAFAGAVEFCATPDICTYMVPEGATVTLRPRPGRDQRACPWVAPPSCSGMEGICTFDMTMDMSASIPFVMDGGGGLACPLR